MGQLDGHCMCGAVSYSCEGDAALTALCHCTECQRQSGAPFSIVVGVPRAALTIEGDTLATYVTTGDDHGQDTERKFCSACGSPIVSLSGAMPDLAFIKAGTLDDTSWLQPQLEVWRDSAQPWVTQADLGERGHFARGPG